MKLLGNWEIGEDRIYKDFQIIRDSKKIEILFGFYWNEYYQGTAYVLFKQDGKLYEVEGSHCSCNGLGGQWEPLQTSLEAIKKRITEGYYFRPTCSWDDDEDESEEMTRERQIKSELRKIIDYESI
jgi:hypothetical protein